MQINLLAVTVIESVIVKCLVAAALFFLAAVVFVFLVLFLLCPCWCCFCRRQWWVLLSLTMFVCVNLRHTTLYSGGKNENLRPDWIKYQVYATLCVARTAETVLCAFPYMYAYTSAHTHVTVCIYICMCITNIMSCHFVYGKVYLSFSLFVCAVRGWVSSPALSTPFVLILSHRLYC